LVLNLAAAHAATSPVPLGSTATGEECRAAPRPGMPPVQGMPAPLDVFCGSGKTPTGSVWIDGLEAGSPGEGPARKAALEATAKRTLEGSAIARRMSCDAGQALGGDQSAQLYSCTLRESGWPQSVLMVGAGNRLYQAEGLPGMLSVLAKAIEQAAGRPVLSAAATGALDGMAAQLGAKGVASGDGGYDAFMRALAKALRRFRVELPRLADFRVRIPPGGRTSALVETVITWRRANGRDTWSTLGVDTDQLAAAVIATEKMLNAIVTRPQRR